MVKTWYPTNFSGFYVNGKSYYKLTRIAIHYKDVSLRLKKYKNWAKIDPTSFQAGFRRNCELRLGTFSWILSQLDCKWKLECFFLSLTLKNSRKLATFFLVVREPRKIYGKWLKKVVRNSEIFPRKCKKCLVVREPRQNLSSGPRVGKGWETFRYTISWGAVFRNLFNVVHRCHI